MQTRLARFAAALLIVCAAPIAIATQTLAQSWPQRPIKVIVPFAAGGGTDFIARLVAKHLSDRLGQQVYVENRGGANGAVGLQVLMQAEPDGYTISVCGDTPLVVNPSLFDKLRYAPLRDFVPVATLVRFPGILAVNPSVPARSVAELIALAKAKPDGLNYSSAGIGNFSHLAMELFKQSTGVNLLHVPYKGTGPASLALIGGEVQIGFNNVQTLLQNVQTGQLRALAVAEPERLAVLPETPTVAETVPGFTMAPWVGVIAPAKTPKEVVERLSKEILAVMRDPQVIKHLADQHVTPYALDAAEMGELLRKDTEKWAAVIKSAGIKPQ
jgi:tripartite-type tricarboxylate transporter receptor subunit TctC